MTDQPPTSPFAMNPARITLLVLGALALVLIVGAILGGVGNYQALRESASSAASAASSSSAP
ncbi:MAG: pilus assembly protein TadG-related protein [Devosia sp.]